MTDSQYNRILAIITTIAVILLGICFIVCCAHLYFTGGDTPYTPASVGKYLRIVAIPSVITIMLMIGGGVMKITSGVKNKETALRTYSEMLNSFCQRYDISAIDAPKVMTKILDERKSRETFKYIAYSFSAVVMALVFAYMIFVANFTITSLNADVVAALTVALPLSVIAVGIHIPRVLLAEDSAKREIDLIKAYIKENGALKPNPKVKKANPEIDYVLIAKGLLLTVSVIFILLGIFNGGMDDVLQKAVKICTECIGLG